MARVQRSVILIFLFMLAACAKSISFSVNINDNNSIASNEAATATPFAAVPSPTPWVEGTQTALANQPLSMTMDSANLTALPTFSFQEVTQQTVERPTDFSPVLYGGNLYGKSFFLLLGGASQNGWIEPAESFARFSGEVTYSLNTLMIPSKYFVWGKAPQFSPTCQNYFVETDAPLEEPGYTAVVDGWNITKREVTELADDGSVYEEVVLNWLKSQGVDTPQPGTLQIVRTDLEGDGVNEIFISATHLDGSQHITNPGDYSIVLMRRAVGNEAVTIPLEANVYSAENSGTTFPRTYSLANFIDLNQDGVMEVVVDIRKWEGFGARIFQINGQNVTQVLSAVC